jgi:hypothetical protein
MASFPGLLRALEYHYLAGLSPAREMPSMPKKSGFCRAKASAKEAQRQAPPKRALPIETCQIERLVFEGLREAAPAGKNGRAMALHHSAATGRPAGKVASPASNGVSGCIRNAQKPPRSNSPIDIRNGKYQLPVTSIT